MIYDISNTCIGFNAARGIILQHLHGILNRIYNRIIYINKIEINKIVGSVIIF
jgi:hypothetical protein